MTTVCFWHSPDPTICDSHSIRGILKQKRKTNPSQYLRILFRTHDFIDLFHFSWRTRDAVLMSYQRDANNANLFGLPNRILNAEVAAGENSWTFKSDISKVSFISLSYREHPKHRDIVCLPMKPASSILTETFNVGKSQETKVSWSLAIFNSFLVYLVAELIRI